MEQSLTASSPTWTNSKLSATNSGKRDRQVTRRTSTPLHVYSNANYDEEELATSNSKKLVRNSSLPSSTDLSFHPPTLLRSESAAPSARSSSAALSESTTSGDTSNTIDGGKNPTNTPISTARICPQTPNLADFNSDPPDEENNDTKCSLFGCYRPAWLQHFASIKTFVVVLIIQGTLVGIMHSYHSGIISTIEKRFRLPTSIIGTIGAVGEIGELSCIFFVAHYGGSGHRPRWIAVGTLFLAISAGLSAAPELFAPSTASILSGGGGHKVRANASNANVELCDWTAGALIDEPRINTNKANHCVANGHNANKTTEATPSYIPPESWPAVILLFASSLFQNVGASFGMTLSMPYVHDNVHISATPIYFSLIHVGSIGGPILGSTLSSVFTSLWVNPFRGPPPGITGRDDPRWIGAWYMGFLIVAVLFAVISLALSVFPRRMPSRKRQCTSKPPSKFAALCTFRRKRKVRDLDGKEQQKDQAVADGNFEDLMDPHTDGLGEPVAVISAEKLSFDREKPHNLDDESMASSHPQYRQKTLRELPRDFWLVVTSLVVMARALAGAFDAFVIAGFFRFLMKYAQETFRYPPYIINIAIGFSGILPAATGMFIGGLIIRRFKLQPKHIAGATVITHVMITAGTLVLATFNCGSIRMAGLDQPFTPEDITPPVQHFTTLHEFLHIPPYSTCSSGGRCHCSQLDFNPVCDMTAQLTYFSPCYAGCTKQVNDSLVATYFKESTHHKNEAAKGVHLYSNCSCSVHYRDHNNRHRTNGNSSNHTRKHRLVREHRLMRSGYCEKPCKALFGYVALTIVLSLVVALPMSGSVMILYRIVPPDLKSMAQAVQSFLSSAIAFAPAPIIVGALFDSTCRLWNTRVDRCNGASSKGNCLLYDIDALRWKYHALPAGLRLMSTLCDIVVFWKVRKLLFETQADKSSKTVVGH